MKNPFFRCPTLAAVFLAIAWIAGCGSSQKHDFETDGVLRLIDRLGPEQVIATPLSDITEKFETQEENLAEDLRIYRELSTSRKKVWSATTRRSILGESEELPPSGMSIFLNGSELPFFTNAGDGYSWKWIETSRNIDLRFNDNYNKGFKCVVLDEDESLVFDSVFPNAPVEIEIYARRNWHPMELKVLVDDQPLGSQAVGRNFDFFRFEGTFEAGTRRITILSQITERLKHSRPNPPRLLIYQVKIKTRNDLVLFFPPLEGQADPAPTPIRIRYLTDQDEQGRTNPFSFLYRIRNDFTLDKYAQPVNPDHIKKKLVLENLSLDALIAPPDSRFEFEIEPSEGCRLEFAAGIFGYLGQADGLSARFRVLAETGDAPSRTLYDQTLRLEEGYFRDQLRFARVDLGEFAGRRIRLVLLTENPEGVEANPDSLALAFWHNPIVYRPSREGLKVILVSLDTLRADHLACYGYERNTSPALDALVSDSVLFENTYAQSPWTLPSHLSMLFGLNSAGHQVYFNNQSVDPSLPSLATHLKNHGFVTQAFTGGGYVSSIYGFSKGFDWYDEPVGGRKAPLGINEAESLFQTTADWLEKNGGKPFFLFLHTFQIHGPYICPEPWDIMFLEKDAPWTRIALRNFLDEHGDDYSFSETEKANIVSLYDGEIRYTDDVLIGPLIDFLKRMGIYDQTLLIVTADHGEEFDEHGGWLHGRTVYDELLKVPLIIKYPASRFKGLRVTPKARIIDLLPTILEEAGINFKTRSIDGRSLIPLIEGREHEDRVFISDLAHKDIPDPCPALIATNKDRLKFIITKSKGGIKSIETYDLMRDPGEKQNIFRRAESLREEVIRFLEDYYESKMKVKRTQGRVHMDKELEEKLKALGYLR